MNNQFIMKSTRRVFHCKEGVSIEERKRWRADFVASYGTGILFRLEGGFFLLTARHVIGEYIDRLIDWETPFFIQWEANAPFYEETESYGFPLITWLNEDEREFGGVDINDVCLVDMGFLTGAFTPDFFLREKHLDQATHVDNLLEGEVLFITGYPEDRNGYEYFDGFGEISDGITHSTTISRYTRGGLVERGVGGELPFLRFTDELGNPKEVDQVELNGLSGGVVYVLRSGYFRLVGMAVTASGSILRFIPFCFISKFIKNKTQYKVAIMDNSQFISRNDAINRLYEEHGVSSKPFLFDRKKEDYESIEKKLSGQMEEISHYASLRRKYLGRSGS